MTCRVTQCSLCPHALLSQARSQLLKSSSLSSSCGKEKKSPKAGLSLGYTNTKKVKSNPKQLSCRKKECGPEKGYGEKRCEIQGGGQEMAVMVG